ncbi:hypothetical protein [Endozoicomonas sp.]|uniref:hypothetical protein n=1 Tax=Endozoicomonas sp. TaxID=1892382 RepID=UPI00383B0542
MTVRGKRLTQEHRDLVGVILTHYKPSAIYSDGSWEFRFTLYDLQKALGKNSHRNNNWIKSKLDDLQIVQIILEPSKGQFERIACSVLNDHCLMRGNNIETGKTGNPLYTVTFNRHYLAFFEEDINVHTEALTDAILDLENPATQSLVRYCLTHNELNMRLSQILNNIGVQPDGMAKETRSRVKKKVISELDVLRDKFGINIEIKTGEKDPIVYYKKHTNVWFMNPKKAKS